MEQIAAQFKKYNIHGLLIVGGFEVYSVHFMLLPNCLTAFSKTIMIIPTFRFFCLLAAVTLL